MKLEENIMVTVYEIREECKLRELDSPHCGMINEQHLWAKEYGFYRSQEIADVVIAAMVEKRIKQGWKLRSMQGLLENKNDEHITISIFHRTIPKQDITKDKDGVLYYQGKKIMG